MAKSAALDVSEELLDWSSDGPSQSIFALGDARPAVQVSANGGDVYDVGDGETCVRLKVRSIEGPVARFDIGDSAMAAVFAPPDANTLHVASATRTFTLRDRSGFGEADAEGGGGRVVAPMHGKLLSVDVAPDAIVRKGDRLAVLEAMKMQHEILAEIDGTVVAVVAQADAQLAADDLIIEIEATTMDQG